MNFRFYFHCNIENVKRETFSVRKSILFAYCNCKYFLTPLNNYPAIGQLADIKFAIPV